jgi:NAD(P)-dependent dehydrogenase (short-subunit alcohol dehydrogenase family)
MTAGPTDAAPRRAVYPDLTGKVVLVTGGATGIGADIVRAFARQGSRVAFLDIQEAPAAGLVAELAGTVPPPLFLRCDLTDLAALTAAVRAVGDQVGPVSVLVNNAADDTRHRLDEITPEVWDRAQAINLRPQFFAAQAVAPMMRAAGGGAIINLSSIAWRLGVDGLDAYGAAKAGVLGLTRSLARALGPQGIRVNAIEPGAVMTDRQRRLWYPTPESVAAMVERQTLRQPLLGSDIARAVLFLSSDEARMITGQSLIVDAGMV